jgi:hypothetical protein
VFAANRFRFGGIALFVLVWVCVAAPAHAADVTITDPTVTEGDAATPNATFTVTLTSAEAADVTLDYQTEPGAAEPGGDFEPTIGQITFAAGGPTSQTINVPILDESEDEPTQEFFLILTGPGLADAVTGTGTILDDDATFSVSDVTVTEGSVGTTDATFTVTASSTDSGDISVGYATSDSSASAPLDYASTTGSLTFAEFGPTTQTITVPVVADTTEEPNETFFVNLTSPSANAVLADALGTGRILNDDFATPPPDVSIGNVSIAEGNSGITNATFTVTLSGAAPGGAATIEYSTANGTATAPGDYTSTSGTLNFASGDVSETITVPVVGDTAEEAAETFVVNLSNPSPNVSLIDTQATGTILNDDLDPFSPGVTDEDTNPTVQARVLRGVTLVPSKRRLSRSALLRLNGVLRVSGGPASCRSRQKIAIQRRKSGERRFQTFEVAVTSRSGSFKTSTRPGRTYLYRARVSQTRRCMGATSKAAKVVVRKRSKGGSARR